MAKIVVTLTKVIDEKHEGIFHGITTDGTVKGLFEDLESEKVDFYDLLAEQEYFTVGKIK